MTKWPVHPLAPTPISAVGQQEFASGTLTNHFHICTHSEATMKYHNQTYDTEIHISFEWCFHVNIFSVIYTYTPTQPLSFNFKNEITLLYSFKAVHTIAIYIFTLILLRSLRTYSKTRGEQDLKCFKRATKEKKSDIVLWLHYNSLKEQTVFLPNWQIPTSKLHIKMMFIQSKKKDKQSLNTRTHTFTQILNSRSYFPLPAQTLLFSSKFYMPYGAQPFNTKRAREEFKTLAAVSPIEQTSVHLS